MGACYRGDSGYGRRGSGPHLPLGPGPGPREAKPQGQGVLWPQVLGGVLPPAHRDAKSERGIVCLDAWTLCVHAHVRGRQGPLMSQESSAENPGQGQAGPRAGGRGGWPGQRKQTGLGSGLGPLTWA